VIEALSRPTEEMDLFGSGPIGEHHCEAVSSAPCVLGGAEGFEVNPAGEAHDIGVDASVLRVNSWLDPPIPDEVSYENAPHTFALYFESEGDVDSRIDGTAHGDLGVAVQERDMNRYVGRSAAIIFANV
jgi:hypothetical protein